MFNLFFFLEGLVYYVMYYQLQYELTLENNLTEEETTKLLRFLKMLVILLPLSVLIPCLLIAVIVAVVFIFILETNLFYGGQFQFEEMIPLFFIIISFYFYAQSFRHVVISLRLKSLGKTAKQNLIEKEESDFYVQYKIPTLTIKEKIMNLIFFFRDATLCRMTEESELKKTFTEGTLNEYERDQVCTSDNDFSQIYLAKQEQT